MGVWLQKTDSKGLTVLEQISYFRQIVRDNILAIMKFLAIGLLFFQSMAIGSSTPEVAAPTERLHSRDVVKRARDCGVFTMTCENAAAWRTSQRDYGVSGPPLQEPPKCLMRRVEDRYDATNDDTRNRVQSGCQASNGRSACNSAPFSQAFHDPQDNRPGDKTINCDEWPMAITRQNDFVPGQVRNSLRCIDQGENSSGGSQLANFFRDVKPTRGEAKTCPGLMQDGDTWQIKFDLAGADPSKTRYCQNKGFCDNDGFQFHMTAKNGPFGYPYNPSTMNRYTQEGTGGKDLLQCSVVVNRRGNQGFTITVFDNTGTRRGQQGLSSFAPTGSVVVPGLPATLTFSKTGPFAASGAGMG
ncbi:MAG: hypothetical protein Q9169_007879, partial [Polycauliona sp. 2 TL-2023]